MYTFQTGHGMGKGIKSIQRTTGIIRWTGVPDNTMNVIAIMNRVMGARISIGCSLWFIRSFKKGFFPSYFRPKKIFDHFFYGPMNIKL